MHYIKSIIVLNLTILMKDKISLLWSVVLPIIMLAMNPVTNEYSLVYWWVFIVMNAYLYGVGIYALSERDSGFLSIIFSIQNSPILFFCGALIVQVIYSFICMILFNVFATFMLGFSFLKLCLWGSYVVIVSLPVAFVGYNVTYIRNMYATSINSIVSIAIFSLFVGMNVENIRPYNPIVMISEAVYRILDNRIPWGYILGSVGLILLSIPSILYFKPISSERR